MEKKYRGSWVWGYAISTDSLGRSNTSIPYTAVQLVLLNQHSLAWPQSRSSPALLSAAHSHPQVTPSLSCTAKPLMETHGKELQKEQTTFNVG